MYAVYVWKAPGTWPFLAIFAFGYLYFAFLTFQVRWLSCRTKMLEVAPAILEPEAVAV